ncbi:MAG TPA: gliding motility-associated C-terminal domain-containing protein [Chitinophagales bacterium]
MSKNRLLFFTVLMISVIRCNAQTFYSNGARVAVMGGAKMIVTATGTGTNNGTLEIANNGIFKNKGEVHIQGSFQNTSGTTDGYASNTGKYIVRQDWINDDAFNADQSQVFLSGTAQQIGGTSITTFYNLICENALTTKSLAIDANVQNTLTLDSNELATNNHKMTILNPATNAIVTNGGDDAFVSSTSTGRLVRQTNSTGVYLFPTGWNNGGTRIKREVEISPENAVSKNYAVRFAFNTGSSTTTTDDGYNSANISSNVASVNNKFYHLISCSDGTPATLGIYFNPAQDNNWTSIGRWQGAPFWSDLGNASVSSGSPRSKVIHPNWSDNGNAPHALVKPSGEDNHDYAFPNAFAPASTDGSVPPENTVFTIINNNHSVILDELMVFNRWGEMVFNSKRDGTDIWSGYFQGKLQEQGNYTYLAKLRKSSNGNALPPVSGNLTLIW